MSSLDISPYLFGARTGTNTNIRRTNGSTANATTSSWLPRSVIPSMNTFSGTNTGSWGESVKRIGSYLLAVTAVVLILLLFIHFFIRPVFRWKPGAPGWIPVPGWDDGVLFWAKGNTGSVPNTLLPIHSQSFDYTVQVDLFLQNPLQFATHPRILLTRGGIRKSPPSGETLLGVLQQYNFAIALKPDTNDMIVSVLNKDNHMETAILPNVPVQEPFRLIIVVMEKAMEVYMNGRLLRTTTFQAPPRDVKGDIAPASGIESNIARYRNLKVWSRVLTTPEIRDSTPALSTAKDMEGGPIPTTSSCASDT